jgi:hypothetical protein
MNVYRRTGKKSVGVDVRDYDLKVLRDQVSMGTSEKCIIYRGRYTTTSAGV